MTNGLPSTAPEGFHSIMPAMVIQGASDAIEYYKTVFGATERVRMQAPDGKIFHAQLLIYGSIIMLSDEYPDWGIRGPLAMGGSPVSLYLTVPDVDTVVDRALAHGATLAKAVENQFYGSRAGIIIDPFGHIWHIATRVEDVSLDEVLKRGEAMMASGSCS